MDKPFNDIRELAGEADWNGDWGEMPASSGDIADFIRKKADAAPRLIPIYGHRYMPAAAVENPPVFSICGLDVIIYGSDLETYFQAEFGGKSVEAMDLKRLPHIPFWSDLL